MDEQLKTQLKKCFELMVKIKEEYPEGVFDREMLHGDMDFRYRRISELRDKIEALPTAVKGFAKFKDALGVSDNAVRSFFHEALKTPDRFSVLVGIGFKERRQVMEKWAGELQISTQHINELLTRSRLSGILDVDYRLNEDYRGVIMAYLDA
ncbi:MAG: hypothetical protein JSW04_02435 [Desulfobacterales bacterium]|nr:MAG: hypothetical protein JSV38_10420 [Desulfobacterales bacterium]UCD90317.1 MAG: hypothetical protein JSW04_02435 [Desulfobacterales bacterium]